MRRILISLILATACANAALAEQAPATLEVISGAVLVDQGQGMVVADQFTLLNAKDKILMKSGSSALLVNNSAGCVLSLREEGIYQVPEMTDCHAGQAGVLKSNITITPANGVYVPAEPVFVGGGESVSQSGIVFGLGFAAIIGAIGAYSLMDEATPLPQTTPISSY